MLDHAVNRNGFTEKMARSTGGRRLAIGMSCPREVNQLRPEGIPTKEGGRRFLQERL